ncbi:TolC family protein [Mariniblastus fucicola]|nr:TolC family protein [Mariniblastus fucicola]
MNLRVAQWLLVMLLVGGCADRNTRGPIPTLHTSPEFTESGSDIAPNRWWTAFEDPQLDLQINDALTNNYSLASATYRVQAARAVTQREASDFWPDIDGILGFGSDMGPGENGETYNFGLDASYPVDLWGEIESRVEAQRLRAIAECWDYHTGALALTAEITSVWFSLIEAHAQAKLLEEQIKTNRTGLELQEERFRLGLIRSADVLRQRQLLESTLEQEVVVELQVEVLEHQLAVLLGDMPQLASYESGTLFPEMPPLPTTGFPSELLLRRPDIQRNYYALMAADKDLASAISAQYPRLNLGGSIQNIAENPEELFKDWFVSLGGQLIAPLFDGGQRRAEVERNRAVKYQLFNDYAQSVLVAFREVEDALAQEKYQLKQIEHLEEQVKLAGQASIQLREQYLIGDVEYLDVLSAITGQQSLQRRLLSAQLDLRLIRVSLYLALAGSIEATNVEGEDFAVDDFRIENAAVGNDQPIFDVDSRTVGVNEPINTANVDPNLDPPGREPFGSDRFSDLLPEESGVDESRFGQTRVNRSKTPVAPDANPQEIPLLERLRGTTNNE